jgi:hypothetical protein
MDRREVGMLQHTWFDQRAIQRQTYRPLPGTTQPNWKWHGTGVHTYTHDDKALAYVAQCRQREIEKMRLKAKLTIVQPIVTPILSDSDWCAFPPTTNAHAPKLTGMARGVSGEVVYQWKPVTDQMKLIQAAQRIAWAA